MASAGATTAALLVRPAALAAGELAFRTVEVSGTDRDELRAELEVALRETVVLYEAVLTTQDQASPNCMLPCVFGCVCVN